MNKKPKIKREKGDCDWCNDYSYRSHPSPEDIKNEEMVFLSSVGVKIEKVKSFEDAMRIILR
jgi:hypothetical protein